MQQQLRNKLASISLSQPQTMVQHISQEDGCSSTKGSYVAPDLSGEDTHTEIPYQYELYVNNEDHHLAIIGKVYKLGSTIHHQTLDEDHMKVDFDGSKKKLEPKRHLRQLYLSRGSRYLYGFIDPLPLQTEGLIGNCLFFAHKTTLLSFFVHWDIT
ncbi:hypothetical protein CR513_17244, partial [Mucuna pruriens]